ncbi:MAG TPA: zinc ribbon domain-containing protein [Roseiflexaceae bacterium]|nr:zinc ribbon domain-containing protein [Roseiflexaceae bacterium]
MQATAKCSTCGGRSPADALFCIECGESLSSATGVTTRLSPATCRACGAERNSSGNFCSMCGQPFEEPVAAGLPWPAAQTPPHTRGGAPRPGTPVASYPRVQNATPPAGTRPARGNKSGFSLAGAILIVGIAVLVLFKLISLPLILTLAALAFFVHQAEHGRAEQALRTLLAVGALIFVLANPKFWPALLLVFIGMKILGR